MIVAGVDPGAAGALALLDAETRRVVAIVDMPMAGGELLVRDLVVDIEAALDGRRVGAVYIERQVPFAKEGRRAGSSSSFTMGERFMAPKAIAACFGWPAEIISPAKWQKHFGIAKADKARSLALATQLMPEDSELWSVRRGYCTKAQAIGRCEASLIGMYGLRMLAGIAQPIRGLAELVDDDLDRVIDAESGR